MMATMRSCLMSTILLLPYDIHQTNNFVNSLTLLDHRSHFGSTTRSNINSNTVVSMSPRKHYESGSSSTTINNRNARSRIETNEDNHIQTKVVGVHRDLTADWVSEAFNKPDAANRLDVSLQNYLRSFEDHQQDDVEINTPMEAVVGPSNVLIYDTSLRDGTQGESISVSCDDKLKIAAQLSEFQIDYIEAGWPGSNPKDAEFFARARTELSSDTRSKLVAFGSTRRKRIDAKDDTQIQALLDAETPTVCIVAKSHLWQVTDIIRATPEENLEMIHDSVSHLVSNGRKVFVDLEHFYDGYGHNATYALQCATTAARAGASGLVLCDTNGGSMPWTIDTITRDVVSQLGGRDGVTIGIHTHNDCGMASANSLMAVRSGAGMVQGTMNGIGERTGNADLCTIIPSLALHGSSNLTCRDSLSGLTTLSRFVDETMNRSPVTSAPFVGASAFAHKGGLHVAAMERSPDSYQHIDPTAVGNEKRVLISELSGRQNILDKIREAGVLFGDTHEQSEVMSERANAILERVKLLESIGYTFEGANASVHLMILHATRGYCPPFSVLDYSAQVFDSNMDSASRVMRKQQQQRQKQIEDDDSSVVIQRASPTARATIKIRTPNVDAKHGDELYTDRLEAADGKGPIDALGTALTNALKSSHPLLSQSVIIVDYKVRILDPKTATEAAARVMIEFKNVETDTSWTTVSVDRNIISASLNALVDGFEYALIEDHSECMLCDDFFDWEQ